MGASEKIIILKKDPKADKYVEILKPEIVDRLNRSLPVYVVSPFNPQILRRVRREDIKPGGSLYNKLSSPDEDQILDPHELDTIDTDSGDRSLLSDYPPPAKTCDKPKPSPHGKWDCDGMMKECNLVCDEGYSLKEPVTITCGPNCPWHTPALGVGCMKEENNSHFINQLNNQNVEAEIITVVPSYHEKTESRKNEGEAKSISQNEKNGENGDDGEEKPVSGNEVHTDVSSSFQETEGDREPESVSGNDENIGTKSDLPKRRENNDEKVINENRDESEPKTIIDDDSKAKATSGNEENVKNPSEMQKHERDSEPKVNEEIVNETVDIIYEDLGDFEAKDDIDDGEPKVISENEESAVRIFPQR